MDSQKFDLILDRLLEKTEEGKLEWETTSDRNTFLVALKDSSVSISYVIESIAEFATTQFYLVNFRNENGDIAASINPSNKEQIDKVKRIFDLARSQSLKVDQTVDRILEQLAA